MSRESALFEEPDLARFAFKCRKDGEPDETPEALLRTEPTAFLEDIRAGKISFVFSSFDPRVNPGEDLIDPKKDEHVFNYVFSLIKKGERQQKALEILICDLLCFLDACAKARSLMLTQSGNPFLVFEWYLLQKAYPKYADFFRDDRGMILERDTKSSSHYRLPTEKYHGLVSEKGPSDSDRDTASSETHSSAASDLEPIYNEPLALAVSPRFFKKHESAEFERKKAIIISALEFWLLGSEAYPGEEELVLGVAEVALKKYGYRFEESAFDPRGRNSAQAREITNLGLKQLQLEQLRSQNEALNREMQLKMRSSKYLSELEIKDPKRAEALRRKENGIISSLRLAETWPQIRQIMQEFRQYLSDIDAGMNKGNNSYLKSPLHFLLEDFVCSGGEDLKPFERWIRRGEKIEARERRRLERADDPSIALRVLAGILQFLSELLALLCETKEPPKFPFFSMS